MKIETHTSLLSKKLQVLAFSEKQVDCELQNTHFSFSFTINLY